MGAFHLRWKEHNFPAFSLQNWKCLKRLFTWNYSMTSRLKSQTEKQTEYKCAGIVTFRPQKRRPYRIYKLRASAWETGAELEMKISRFRLKLVHKVVMWTYVICQSFRFNDLLWVEFWISAPQGCPEADFQCNFWSIFSLSFSNVQLISDKNKNIFVMPYS